MSISIFDSFAKTKLKCEAKAWRNIAEQIDALQYDFSEGYLCLALLGHYGRAVTHELYEPMRARIARHLGVQPDQIGGMSAYKGPYDGDGRKEKENREARIMAALMFALEAEDEATQIS